MWTSERTDSNVVTVRMTADGMGWEQRFLLRADAHHDNPQCRKDLELSHLEEARKCGAGIIDIGDLFCAMQGKADRRSDKSYLDPKFCDGDFFDSIVNEADDFYGKYANNFVQLSMGNHESSVRKNNETNLTKRLVRRLNNKSNHEIFTGGYSGWIRFCFTHNKTANCSKSMWYIHGYGGGGPVTEDMIQSNRQRVVIKADIMASAHVHRAWQQDYETIQLAQNGIVERRPGIYIKVPTYKDEWDDGSSGFAVERFHGHRPLGAWWLIFRYNQRKRISIDVARAR